MKTIVSIPGMHCNSCVEMIKEVSSEFPSIQEVNVDLKSKKVTLEHNEHFDRGSWTKEVESLSKDYKVLNQ